MKLLMAMILLVGAMNTYAACVADVKGACKDEAECKAEVGKGKEVVFSTDKICSVKTEASSLPDCKFVYDGKGGEQTGEASGSKDGKAASSGK